MKRHVFSICLQEGADRTFGIDLFDTDFRLFYDYRASSLFLRRSSPFFAAPWDSFLLCSSITILVLSTSQIVFVPGSVFFWNTECSGETSRRRTFFGYSRIEQSVGMLAIISACLAFLLFFRKASASFSISRPCFESFFVQLSIRTCPMLLWLLIHPFECSFIHFDRRLFFFSMVSIYTTKKKGK